MAKLGLVRATQGWLIGLVIVVVWGTCFVITRMNLSISGIPVVIFMPDIVRSLQQDELIKGQISKPPKSTKYYGITREEMLNNSDDDKLMELSNETYNNQAPNVSNLVQIDDNDKHSAKKSETVYMGNKTTKQFLVTWYEYPHFINTRVNRDVDHFSNCEYSNCILSKIPGHASRSDAVIFKGRSIPKQLPFKRPLGQVWIFYEHEAPISYHYGGNFWQNEQYRGSFNWTMTYDRTISDIFIPYGEFRTSSKFTNKDHVAISKSKTRDAVIVTSHCKTFSKRSEYIEKLRKYISVDILGSCGTRWNCGKVFTHDDACFESLSKKYRYYLAFENSICRGYRTEKLFDNFKYDLIIITRGDMSSFVNDSQEPKDAYISTSQFGSIEAFGKYLQYISNSTQAYSELLKAKDKYETVPYSDIYENALCDICKRLNMQDEYHQEISDLRDWRDLDNTCYFPKDLK